MAPAVTHEKGNFMGRPNKSGGQHNASMTMENLAAYGVGVTIVIFALGPAYQVLCDPFVNYVVGYYGEAFSGIAAVFLFLLLALLIFSFSTVVAHTLSGVWRARTHIFGSLFKFK